MPPSNQPRLEGNGHARDHGLVYRELAAPPLACLWIRVMEGDATDVLPDGCSDLIWRAGRGAFVAGPDTGPVRPASVPGTVLVGARFRPGAGGAALGMPLSELRDLRVGLDELRPDLAARLPGDLDPLEALRRMAEIALAAPPADAAVSEAARRLAQPQTRVEALAADLGLSERQLRRRFHAAAGYGPKTLQRVLRFRRFLAAADRDLARAALDSGYADQSHLTRECAQLAGRTPAALLRA
jgi:AraC-like DNA-binding protein